MRLGYFAMPMHPLGRRWEDTLREDREAVILADRLGFHDAFIGEHLTDQHENITNSLLFLATLITETSQIRLGTGTTNLSQQHPVLVAANSAMFDHLSGGRFILGISPGALPSDAEVLEVDFPNRNQLFLEAIDIILAIWESDPPYAIRLPDNRFTVTTDIDVVGWTWRSGGRRTARASTARVARPHRDPRLARLLRRRSRRITAVRYAAPRITPHGT